jgi:hypothetical protein
VKPECFTLPSGARVEIGVGPELEVAGVFRDELSGLHATLSRRTGKPISIEELPLADFHTLRAILRKLGLVSEQTLEIPCSNCNTAFTVVPSSELELRPYPDDELDDPELDGAFDFETSHEVPSLSGDSEPSRLRLRPLCVSEASPFHSALRADRPLRVTSGVVEGMGIVEIDGVTNARKLARLLASAPDSAFDAVAEVFEEAHYPRRLDVPHRCPKCGISEWVSVPRSRELALEQALALQLPRGGDQFMSIDEFERLVRGEAEKIWRNPDIALSVIEDAAEVDASGEPLLGCYRPPEPEALLPEPAEIRVFYQTFANMWREDGRYDVLAEVAETLRHELEHHGGHLTGNDPLDDAEQEELRREHVRRVGKSETDRRALRDAYGGAREFIARTWPLWTVVLLATLAAILASR